MRILSGIQSSGKQHIGNYYGALRQFVDLQNAGEALYFIANLHALTTVRDPVAAASLTRETAMAFLALGLDPARAILFRQSDIPEVTELYWILGTVVPLSNLERAHSYKDKIAKGISADFGLFAYPVLMAADILLYGSDLVPVGRDQVQHLEFARDWATKFNLTYVQGYDASDPTGAKSGRPGVLKLPEALVQEATATVPGTDGQKMSKSYNNTIDLFGEEGEVKKRIMGIKTDCTPVEAPEAGGQRALPAAQGHGPRGRVPGHRPGVAGGREGLRGLQEDPARCLSRDLRSGARPVPGARRRTRARWTRFFAPERSGPGRLPLRSSNGCARWWGSSVDPPRTGLVGPRK